MSTLAPTATTAALLSRLIALAYADQAVDARELELIYTIALERGVARQQLETILLNPHQSGNALPPTPAERIADLYDLARLVLADEVVRPEEEAMLRRSVLLYQFEEANAGDIVTFLLGHARQGTASAEVLQLVQDTL